MDSVEKDSNRIQTNTGFSLLELLVGLAIFSVIALVLTHQLTLGSRINTEQNAVARAQQSLRAARLIISQDLRLAGLDPNVTFLFGFEEASATKFRVTADVDEDGMVDNTGGERVTYQILAGTGQLQRILYETTPAVATATLLDRIDPANSGFIYRDAAGVDLGNPVPIANLEDIRTVEVTLAVEETAGRAGIVNRDATSRVLCRNMAL